ncbi:MAG: hypothetical protein B6D56_01270 [Candidatus Omnitrophica bacterium 4484_70.1]|nr:MAG: hypothetical protein B6D56_01270 [Candidatus Omnitrophica bacterium 4484_70.1]
MRNEEGLEMKDRKEINVRKAENGYVIKTLVIKEGGSKNHIDAMIKLMRATGMYESWQEHKEEEIRRALEKMMVTPIPQKEEKEIVCSSMEEVITFMKSFFQDSPDIPISL